MELRSKRTTSKSNINNSTFTAMSSSSSSGKSAAEIDRSSVNQIVLQVPTLTESNFSAWKRSILIAKYVRGWTDEVFKSSPDQARMIQPIQSSVVVSFFGRFWKSPAEQTSATSRKIFPSATLAKLGPRSPATSSAAIHSLPELSPRSSSVCP